MSNTCWGDGFACRSEDMVEKGYDHAHEEDNCHQSGEGDHHRDELEEEKCLFDWHI